MTVSVVEVGKRAVGSLGTAPTVSLTTTPAAGDVVVLVLSAATTTTMSAVSGLGATWVVSYGTSNTTGTHWFAVGTGATASGTITATISSSRVGIMNAYLVRGLTSSATSNPDTLSVTGTSLTGPTATAALGQIVFDAYYLASTGTITWPDTGSSPSAGAWVGEAITATTSSHSTAYAIAGTSATFGTVANSASAAVQRISQIIVGSTSSSITGTIAATLPSLTASAAGTVTLAGSVAAALPSLTASASGVVTRTGTVAATLPSLTASASGNVSGTIGGAMSATLLSLTASITGTLPTPVTGTVAATLPALSARITDGSTVVTPISVDLTAGTSLTVGTTLNVTPVSVDLTSGTVLRAAIPRTYVNDPRTGTPQYQLRVVDDAGTPVADIALKATMDDLGEALNDPTSFGFTLPTLDPRAALVTPTDYKRPPTVQLWRGGYLAGWVDILRAVPSSDGATTSFQCQDRRWTLEHEHIGKSPLRNLIRNGDFSEGDKYGTYGWDASSTPAAPPLHSVVADDFSSSGFALELTGADRSQLVVDEVATEAVFAPNSATYLPGGEAQIQAVGNTIPNGSTIHLTGHTANNSINGDYGDGLTLSLNRALAAKGTLAAMGKGFVFALADTSAYKPGTFVTGSQCVGRGFYSPRGPNATDSQQAYNRRVTIAYEGISDGTQSAQWRMVSARVTHPTSKKRPLTVTAAGEFKITTYSGPNRDNVAVKLTLAKASTPNTILQTQTVTMDGSAGMDSYQGSEVSVDVPADGNEYLLRAYYYAPHGTLRWIDIGMYPDDVLGFYGVDQALIVKALIEHAQDPTMGRATLNLATNCTPTGIPRTREYMFRDRTPIATTVEEFPSLNRGVDIDLVTTATTRTVTTFYPRQGEPCEEVLDLRRNIARYEAPVDLTQVATSVVVQADSIGAHRQEGHAVDASRLGGMILEDIVKAEKETPYRDLQGGAVDRLRLYGGPFPLLSVECLPSATSSLIDRVRKGDTVRVIINDGRTNIDGMFRVTSRKLDPNTDALSYTLAQEV